jgi:MFS family permease
MGTLLARDRDFRMLIVSRLLVGASGLAIPFYIIFTLDVLRLGPESVGVFTAAQVVGSIASAPLMAWLSERRGTRSVIRLVAGMALLLPIVGLGLLLLRPALGQVPLLAISSLIFFLMGGVNNGNMAGFTNYLLDYAPGTQRPVYIGLANTINGLVLVAPVVGGWILAASSYRVLFAVTAAVSIAGLASTSRLREPRAGGISETP